MIEPEHAVKVRCAAVCDWELPARPGFASEEEADRWMVEEVKPHLDAGHAVRVVLTTTHRGGPNDGLVERSTATYSPVQE